MKLETQKLTKIWVYTIKIQALRTPRVLTAFDDNDNGNDNEKPPAAETRKPVWQDALDQLHQEAGSGRHAVGQVC